MNDMILSEEHYLALRKSAILDEIIRSRGYRTITHADELRALGFSPQQSRVPGLLLPLWTTDGGNGLYAYRPDHPRVVTSRSKKNPDGTYPNKVIKYELPKGARVRLDCPPKCQPLLADPKIPLWITEGQKKADSLASLGLCAIDLLGVWNFTGRNKYGGITFLADWQYVALNDRDVRIVFDSDMLTKSEVRSALDRLTQHLQRKGANVAAVYLPVEPGKGKIGVDDWLALGHTADELNALIEAPHPAPQPAPAIIEILDVAPLSMTRPLVLLDQQSYAATWLYTRTAQKETLNKQGEIIRHNPPLEKTERRMFVIREDGMIFGEGGDRPMEELQLFIHLPEIPAADQLMSAPAVKAYAAGNRVKPADVFQRVVDMVNRFIDFDRSLADQQTMSELLACYIFSTWFLDAFSVVGFIWPNGDRGSGKTHLLIVVTQLAYLGELILAGGSFASLRDLADYGATLAFDDAENLSDPKRTDSDKRALLLAGNRRGVTIPLKELGPDKAWHTRHVNGFCPRLFSAIKLPDPILASRTITIPLIRTVDRHRANVDPLDYGAWPHSRQKLIDDLWSLALTNLSKLPQYDNWVGRHARLTGRALQPWRAILAIAAWLDQNSIPGLWQRIETVSVEYQNERLELETYDLTSLTIRALIECAVANVANVANDEGTPPHSAWDFSTSKITEVAQQIARASDGEIDPDIITTRRIGQVLKKMRLTKPSRPRGQTGRIWRITLSELDKWAAAYGLPTLSQIYGTTKKVEPLSEIGYIGYIGYNPDSVDDTSIVEGEI